MSKQVQVHIVNGFIKNGKGGNPAGVVLNADNLTEAEKKRVAAKVGHSETAFLSKSETCTVKVDFFTPTRRIAHCGHATIAAFSYLAQQNYFSASRVTKETVDGPRAIVLRNGAAFMEQLAPKYFSLGEAAGVGVEDALESLQIGKESLVEGSSPTVVNTGNSFLLFHLRSRRELENVKPNQEKINAISERLDLVGYYVFANEKPGSETLYAARMFAPRYGIPEESATGMAAGPLACYSYDKIGSMKTTIKIGQGEFMEPPSPSLITVDLEIDPNGKIKGLMAGGFGQKVKTLSIRLD